MEHPTPTPQEADSRDRLNADPLSTHTAAPTLRQDVMQTLANFDEIVDSVGIIRLRKLRLMASRAKVYECLYRILQRAKSDESK